jgi:uncharacterized protein (TIGR02996 family)
VKTCCLSSGRSAIGDLPEDALPRLVFADWLDEHDWPRKATLQRSAAGHVSSGDPEREWLWLLYCDEPWNWKKMHEAGY